MLIIIYNGHTLLLTKFLRIFGGKPNTWLKNSDTILENALFSKNITKHLFYLNKAYEMPKINFKFFIIVSKRWVCAYTMDVQPFKTDSFAVAQVLEFLTLKNWKT